MTRTRELSEPALDFFWPDLKAGLGLSEAVNVQRRAVRRVFSFDHDAPVDVDLYDFKAGGKGRLASVEASRDEPSLTPDEALAEILTKYFEQEPTLACVLEDCVSRPADQHLANAPELISSGDEIYHVVRSSASIQDCRAAISLAKSASGLRGFMTKLSEFPSTRSRHSASAKQLKAISHDVRLAFVSIYDGENYMLVEF